MMVMLLLFISVFVFVMVIYMSHHASDITRPDPVNINDIL